MITMSSHDLFTIQQQLKKTIMAHQIAVSKLQNDPQNTILQKELHELQKSIKTLSEEQKIAVQSYREQIVPKDKSLQINDRKLENGVINSSNNISINNNNNNVKYESLKPIITRPSIIIPQLGTKQSVAINTQSIKRPALAIKSITGQTQFLVPVSDSQKRKLSFVVPKQRFNYLKPAVVRAQTISSSPSLTTSTTSTALPLKSSSNAQPVHPTSLLIRSNTNKSPTKVPLIKSLSNHRNFAPKHPDKTSPKFSDKQMKDHFMMSLGLVTKEALTELQSRKCERKRRTTANPQFSSAALEAKRISKLEIAERKAKRRLLITNNGDNNTVTQQKTTYLSNGSSNKSLNYEPQEISPGVHIVISIGNFPTANCFVCDELCECDSDSILFCKYCRTLFHATCSSTKADITKNATVPCVKCENIKKKNDEKLAKKREERDNLSARKKELDEQMAQMRLALNNLNEKLKEKSVEKNSLLTTNGEVQKKIDKIIETLKLVEDTSEWEDGFAAALEATAPKAEENQSEVEIEMESNPSEMEGMEAMDSETEKATQQLEQLVKAETNSLEMESDANDIYQLECHENYDLFVEEVQESVDMVTDNVGFFDTVQTHGQHIKGPEFTPEEHGVVLY